MGDWRTWGMGVFAGLVLVAAVVLLAVGWSTHEEPGLLEACEGPGGQYDYGGDCFTVTWDRMPLRVRSNAPQEVGPAMEALNTRLGFTAFVEAAREPADVTVFLGMPAEHGMRPGGATSHFFRGYRMQAHVTLWNTVTTSGTYWVLQHELGHALGLAHDDYTLSLMYPVISDPWDLRKRPRLSDWDRDLLRNLYAE